MTRILGDPAARGTPLWEEGPAPDLPRLEADVEADVCVVGLGGSGLACVGELLRLGARVAGVDAALAAGKIVVVPRVDAQAWTPRGSAAARRDGTAASCSRGSRSFITTRWRDSAAPAQAHGTASLSVSLIGSRRKRHCWSRAPGRCASPNRRRSATTAAASWRRWRPTICRATAFHRAAAVVAKRV